MLTPTLHSKELVTWHDDIYLGRGCAIKQVITMEKNLGFKPIMHGRNVWADSKVVLVIRVLSLHL